MFSVYFVNFRYFSGRVFETFEAAVAFAKKTTFECTICLGAGKLLVGGWSVFRGEYRYY